MMIKNPESQCRNTASRRCRGHWETNCCTRQACLFSFFTHQLSSHRPLVCLLKDLEFSFSLHGDVFARGILSMKHGRMGWSHTLDILQHPSAMFDIISLSKNLSKSIQSSTKDFTRIVKRFL